MAPSERHFSRVGAIAAVAGVIVYTVSAGLHPWTPPHETEAAFADYALESLWAIYHLGELLGILLMGVTVLALAWRLRRGAAGVWAALGAAAMVVCASLYAVFIAVDGVALGIMVDRWAAAGPGQQDVLYETAFACLGALSFGVVQAQTGYSDLSMSFQTGIYMGGACVLAAAWFLYRNPEHADLVEETSTGA